MLDLSRLEPEEPYCLDEVIVVNSFMDTDDVWLRTKANFCKRTLFDIGMKITSCVYSPNNGEKSYEGNLYLTGQTTSYMPTQEAFVNKLVERWRYQSRLNHVVLWKYTYKDQQVLNGSDYRSHGMHFIVTDNPVKYSGSFSSLPAYKTLGA